jgi:hypothetical protein
VPVLDLDALDRGVAAERHEAAESPPSVLSIGSALTKVSVASMSLMFHRPT